MTGSEYIKRCRILLQRGQVQKWFGKSRFGCVKSITVNWYCTEYCMRRLDQRGAQVDSVTKRDDGRRM